MTSMLRSLPDNIGMFFTRGVNSLTYNDISDNSRIVPITYDKRTGIMDFDFSTGFAADKSIYQNTIYVRGSSLDAIRVVNDIGPNIKAWCVENAGADEGSVHIFEKPLIVKCNQIAYKRDPDDDGPIKESTDIIEFEPSSGGSNTNFYSSYLFKKPLVVTYTKDSGATKYYRMFSTQYSDGQT